MSAAKEIVKGLSKLDSEGYLYKASGQASRSIAK